MILLLQLFVSEEKNETRIKTREESFLFQEKEETQTSVSRIKTFVSENNYLFQEKEETQEEEEDK